jgi:uncharacterized protein YqjF (DUF2071 family)
MPKHPLPMRTVFRRCFLANFAVDPETMRSAIPAPIEPDLHNGKAYVSVVIAEMEKMRPAFLPRVFGVTYTQVVYRAVVRCAGERGVYFLHSDADNRLMCAFGNLLTFFRFHPADVNWRDEAGRVLFDLVSTAKNADIHAAYDVAGATHALPNSSRFGSLNEAKTFLVELYSAFGRDTHGRTSRVRIDRGAWDVAIVDDDRAEYAFMKSGQPFANAEARLDSVFYVRDLPYYWHTLERLPQTVAISAGEASTRA